MAAYLVLASLPVVAALIGWAGYRNVQRVQSITSEQVLPTAAAARELAKGVNTWVGAIPHLALTIDHGELESIRDSAERDGVRLRSLLSDLESSGLPAAQIAQLHRLLAEMQTGFEQTVTLRADMLETLKVSSDISKRAESLADSISEMVNPILVNATNEYLDDVERLKSSLNGTSGVGVRDRDLDRLVDDVIYIERLTELRFYADSLSRVIDQLLHVAEAQSVRDESATYGFNLRNMIRHTLQVRDPAVRRELGGILDELMRIGAAETNIFERKLHLIALTGQLATQTEKVRALSRDLITDTEILASNAAALLDKSILKARDIVLLGRNVLLATVVVSVLGATLFFWFYIHRSVIRRLQNLAGATVRLSQGRLDAKVEEEGDDEVARMASALEVFRANSVRLRDQEEALRLRTAQLTRTVEELDQFAYVASHDLRSPLRGVDNLASFVEQDLDGIMQDETKQHLKLMRSRIARLEALLEGLLEYSRAGRTPQSLELVDPRELIRDTFDLVAPEGFALHMQGDLASVATERVPLEQVLRNVFDNAMKHHDRDQGEVFVSCSVRGAFMTVAVRDDGPGIDPAFHERIFGMFQTLRPRDEVEGSGMGLAILKKTVESHGGSIHVHSSPETERGATFTFSWPVQEAANVA